jgi:iron complex transport system ATP-binding protein
LEILIASNFEIKMIKVQNLTFQIGKKYLLKEVSFEVKQGEFLAIIGANGAGKSTLLKLLSKELPLQDGAITWEGKPLAYYSLENLAKKRAVLSQQNSVSLGFSVKEIVMIGRYPHFHFKPTYKDEQIVQEALQKTVVKHLENRIYHTLSGGEQQRVQLARALAQIWESKQAWLFLDEPTTGLDLLHQQEIIEIAKDFAGKGYGIIAILHDLNLAMQYADKVLMLKNGHVAAFDLPEKAMTCENIHQVFDLPVKLIQHPDLQCPMIVPCAKQKNWAKTIPTFSH